MSTSNQFGAVQESQESDAENPDVDMGEPGAAQGEGLTAEKGSEGETSTENQPRQRWADLESDHENPREAKEDWEHHNGEYVAEFETQSRFEDMTNPDTVMKIDWMGEIEQAIQQSGNSHLWNRTMIKGLVRAAMLITRKALPMMLCMHRREFRAAGKTPEELIGVVGHMREHADVENALVTAMCATCENLETTGTDEGIEIIVATVGLRPDLINGLSLGFRRNLFLCFAGSLRECLARLTDTFGRIWNEINNAPEALGPDNHDREAGDDSWTLDGGIEVDTYEEVPFARVKQNRSLWYELVVDALRELDRAFSTTEELRVAGEYAIRFMRFQREFHFKRARKTFRPMRTNYKQGLRAYLLDEADFNRPIDLDEIDTIMDMVNVDPESSWHEGLETALELRLRLQRYGCGYSPARGTGREHLSGSSRCLHENQG